MKINEAIFNPPSVEEDIGAVIGTCSRAEEEAKLLPATTNIRWALRHIRAAMANLQNEIDEREKKQA